MRKAYTRIEIVQKTLIMFQLFKQLIEHYTVKKPRICIKFIAQQL